MFNFESYICSLIMNISFLHLYICVSSSEYKYYYSVKESASAQVHIADPDPSMDYAILLAVAEGPSVVRWLSHSGPR